MAENDPFGGMGFKLPIMGEQKPENKPLELEEIKVPDIGAETAPVQKEDLLVKVWRVSSVCNDGRIFGRMFQRDLAQRPPGSCCRDEIIEVPLSEAKAKGYTLVQGSEPYVGG